MVTPSHIEDELQIFKRQVLQLVDPSKLQWPCKGALRDPSIQLRIYKRLFQSNHPPPERYRLRVLKKLLKLIEESIIDPDEDVGHRLVSHNVKTIQNLSYRFE
jgi:protein-lysine N-methyltransferase EEF2KMT